MCLEEMVIQSNILPALNRLKQAGHLLIATSNQPGVSAGTLNRRELDRMCKRLIAEFKLNDLLICPHDEQDYCPCRKPKPGLFLEAAFKWQINLEQSFVVSGKWQDAEAARQFGATSILIDSPWARERRHDLIATDFESAAEKILNTSSHGSHHESNNSDYKMAANA
jgi:D-glycero-D-manno-heptose 1,7-bisphosphate phosphatase